MELLGRRTWGLVVVGFELFKIMLSYTLIYFPVDPVSDFRVIVLVELFNTVRLYVMNMGGNEVPSVEFNKILLFLFVATFGTVPHRNSVHP